MYSQKDEEQHIIAYFADRPPGRFLDFGAFDPFTFSNTRRLYELGWKGVYVEPSAPQFQNFVTEYGNDPEMVLINQAVSTYDGEITFHNCNSGPSTTSAAHKALWLDRIRDWREEVVPCLSINRLMQQHADRTDFLNIDVEGTNRELLEAIEPRHFRNIRMICIEHDSHELAMIERLAGFGFRAIHHNDENLIFVRGSRWRFRNVRRSAEALPGLVERGTHRTPPSDTGPQRLRRLLRRVVWGLIRWLR